MTNHHNPCSEGHYPYIIQPDDTLQFIANRLEVVLSRVIAANPGIDPYNLRIGQIICIPACPPNHRPYIIQECFKSQWKVYWRQIQVLIQIFYELLYSHCLCSNA